MGHLNSLLFSVHKSCIFTSTFLADGLVEQRVSADGKNQHRLTSTREKQGQGHLANSCGSPVTRQASFIGQAEGATYSPHSIGQNSDDTYLWERLGSVALEQSLPPRGCRRFANPPLGVACKAETVYTREGAVTKHPQPDWWSLLFLAGLHESSKLSLVLNICQRVLHFSEASNSLFCRMTSIA